MTPVEVKLNGSKVKLKEGMMLYCASHGPGKVVSVETKEYLGEKITFCEMRFDKDDMKILTPIDKMKEMGMRTIISKEVAKKILESVLSKPAKSAKGIWTKRIVECQTKLDSGSALLVAEVVRDLFAGMKDPNKSYGERVLFDKAFDRFVDAGEDCVARGLARPEGVVAHKCKAIRQPIGCPPPMNLNLIGETDWWTTEPCMWGI